MLQAQRATRPLAAPWVAVTAPCTATPAARSARQKGPSEGPDRRRALLSLLGCAPAVAVQQLLPPALAADDSLCSRLDAPTAEIHNPGNAKPWAAKQIYYPEWLFGEWAVQQRFIGFRTPLGYEYIPAWAQQSAEASAEDGGVGSTIAYGMRFYSTLPDTLANTFKMNVGLLPSDAIIADRAFNTAAVADATLGYKAVESSAYDTRAPERQTITMTRLNSAGQRLGGEAVEITLSNLRGGGPAQADSSGSNQFCTSELYRQVRGPAVSEFEFITVYTKQADGHVTARQSEAVYRTPQSPQDVLSFRSGGRAVAFYDYALDMRRVPPPSDAVGASACVSTPKGYIQCL